MLSAYCSSYVLEDRYLSASEIFLVAYLFARTVKFFQVKNMHFLYATTKATLIGLSDGFWLRCVV
jgi:hypothetical protein